MADHFSKIMQDDRVSNPLTPEQQAIEDEVVELLQRHRRASHAPPSPVDSERIRKVIKSLKKNCAPGADLITAEHLAYGCSAALCDHLASLFSIMLLRCIVLLKLGGCIYY